LFGWRRLGRILGSGPWRRAPWRLVDAPALLVAVTVAAAAATLAVSTRPLLASSLGTAALRQDLEVCPATVGMVIERSVRIGHPVEEGIVTWPPPINLDESSTAIDRAVADLPGVSPPVRTLFGGEASVSAGDRVTGVQVISRTAALDHVATVARVDGPGVWLSRTTADQLGVGPGDQIQILPGPGLPSMPVAVQGVFVDLQENRDPWWCSLRRQIVGSVNDGAPPFLLLDDPTLLALLRSAEVPNTAASWEVHPSVATWKPAVARVTISRLKAIASDANNGATGLGLTLGPGDSASDPQGSLAHAEQAIVTASATAAPVVLGALGLATSLLVQAVRAWAERRNQELMLLRARGAGNGLLAVKGLIELLPALVVGLLVGVPAATLLVQAAGPTAAFDVDTVVSAVVQSAAAGGLIMFAVGAALVVEVRRAGAARLLGRSRRFVGVLPMLLLAVAAAAFYEIRSRGSAVVEGERGVHVDSLVVLFPVLLVAAASGLAAPALLRRPVLGAVSRLRWSRGGWLAGRRLAANRQRAALVVTASATAVGMAAFASSLVDTLETTAQAKATLDLGAAQVVPITGDGVVPADAPFASRATAVRRSSEATIVIAGHDPFDVVGIEDGESFARVAYWDRSFADRPLPDLLELVTPELVGDGEVPAVAVGAGGPDRFNLVMARDHGQRVLIPIRVVGRANYFPGFQYESRRPLLVISAEALKVREIEADRQLWVAGPDNNDLLAQVRGAGFDAEIVRRASARIDGSVTPQLWALRSVAIVGWATGGLALCALALYHGGIGRRRRVSDVLLRQMGLPARSAALAVVSETAAMFLLAWVIGVGMAWLALRLMYTELDPLPSDSPPPQLRFDTAAALVAAVVALAVPAATTVVVYWRRRRVDETEVLRHAG
jgi:FtsX-like permease family